jgi:hypothetical protein
MGDVGFVTRDLVGPSVRAMSLSECLGGPEEPGRMGWAALIGAHPGYGFHRLRDSGVADLGLVGQGLVEQVHRLVVGTPGPGHQSELDE